MRLDSKRRLRLTGALLATLVVVTRLPFMSHTLFEFDSVDFAVATFRFSLEQITPHMPGYIIHILLGRLFSLLTPSLNNAFVLLSIFLSIGSALFLWRAAYRLRGERVALIVAVLWLTHPFFWFYGEVATAYAYESFFASAILMLGIGLLRNPDSKWRPIALGIVLSLATGARQSSLLFFAPAIIYLLVTTRQSRAVWLRSAFAFAVVTALWGFALIRESGGLATYLHLAGLEHVYRSQSILFGNPLREHLAIIAKVFTYLIAGSIPLIIAACIASIVSLRWTIQFISDTFKARSFRFTVLVAIVPLLFYISVYFMKAGYLLNVWPSIILISGVLIDQCALMIARKRKEKSKDRLLLTRPLITRATILITSVIVLLHVLWFAFPLPGKDEATFYNANTQDSFSESLTKRYEGGDRASIALNRLFAYSSLQAAKAADAINNMLIKQFANSGSKPVTLLATWWSRQAYFYLPKMNVYDIRTDANQKLLVGVAKDYTRHPLADSVIHLPHEATYLLIRGDHPDLGTIMRQVRVRRLNMPKYLDLYEVVDSAFSFSLDGVRFVKD